MGMASVNQTRPHCVNQMGKTYSKPLATRRGRGTAWARQAMCELALKATRRNSEEALRMRNKWTSLKEENALRNTS